MRDTQAILDSLNKKVACWIMVHRPTGSNVTYVYRGKHPYNGNGTKSQNFRTMMADGTGNTYKNYLQGSFNSEKSSMKSKIVELARCVAEKEIKEIRNVTPLSVKKSENETPTRKSQAESKRTNLPADEVTYTYLVSDIIASRFPGETCVIELVSREQYTVEEFLGKRKIYVRSIHELFDYV